MTSLLVDTNILKKLSNSPDVLNFMLNLSPTEYKSLQQLMTWDTTLLHRLKKNPDNVTVLFKAWEFVNDKQEFLEYWLRMRTKPESEKVNIIDAFSLGQLSSKAWLLDRLEGLNVNLGNVWILGGWIGSLAYLMFDRPRLNLVIDTIRSFDMDPNCQVLADTLNKKQLIDDWRFKATTMDVNDLKYTNFKYETFNAAGELHSLTESADTVINTSCDHMGSNNTWWDNIPSGTLVILQNNDYAEVDEHDNIVHSTDEFASKYPMEYLLYAGKLECPQYNRFMLIGCK